MNREAANPPATAQMRQTSDETPAPAAPRGRLARKYALLLIGLIGVALVLNSGFDFWFSYQENKEALVRVQQEKADAAAQRIEGFIGEIERQIGWTTQALWASGSLDQRRFDYVRLMHQVPAITELSQLDSAGKEQLKVSRVAINVVGSGADHSSSPAFVEAKAHGTWFSPVYFRKQSEPYMTLAIRHAGRNAGVTVAEINLKLIWDVITAMRIGKGGYAYVVDGRGRLVAHPDISLVLRDTDLSRLPQVAAALRAPAADQATRAGVAENIAGRAVLTTHATIAPLGWLVFVEVPLREAFAPLYGQAVRSLLLLAAGLVVAAFAAFALARRMTGPIRALQEGAARIGSGDLARRIDIRTGDELEGLAGQFNAMAADLEKSYAELERRVEERTAELAEALDQQTATADVLQVINSSPGDVGPVFESMLEKAMRLCTAAFGYLMTFDGERFRTVAHRGLPQGFAEYLPQMHQPGPSGMYAQIIRGAPFAHVADMKEGEVYRTSPLRRALVDLGAARTGIVVALRKDDALLGVITIYRQEVRPFSDKQIALLQNFAAQAVIAMENARLLTELRQRTADLQESLEYQTATSDVLRVVSRSTFDLAPILQSVVSTAVRLCRADQAVIYRNIDGEYRWAAGESLAPAYERIEREVRIRPGAGTLVGRVALECRAVHIPDAQADPLYEVKDDARVGGIHTMLGVPLLREGAPIGAIGLARRRIEPFSAKEIELVETFADQAVIAIENARLLGELRARTEDLQESLEYQTATSDVLKVISQSGAELGTVLDTVVEAAARICEGTNGFIFRLAGGLLRLAAAFGFSPEYREFMARNPMRLDRGTLTGRTALDRAVVHIPDAATDPEYTFTESREIGGFHTMLGVPLAREGVLVGVLALARSYVDPFTDKQIELVKTFADQAVIAIENARLLGELRERTHDLARSVEELKALGEVGQAVSSTLDLQQVLSTILARSVALSTADAGAIFRYSRAGAAYHLVEAQGWEAELTRQVRELHVAEQETGLGEAAARRMPLQFADIGRRASNPLRDLTLAAGFRSVLVVPLIGAQRIYGAMILMRRIEGEFPEATVRLMQTIATQSVLAIQNARLFREIADKSEELALASQHKSQFLANMSHELRTPLNAILGYTELMVDGIYGELPPRAQGVLERVQNNGKHLLALINDVLDLSKIEAGQLTLSLDDYTLGDVVQSVIAATEPLATKKGLKFTTDLPSKLPTGYGDARRIAQVLLNLVGNAVKFTDEGEVAIGARAEGDRFILTVRDTGPGIAPADHGKIFDEFQQVDSSNTRKKGGTGLGLAISKRMVEMQGGTITVSSVLGAGATFRVTLPVRVAANEAALMEAS